MKQRHLWVFPVFVLACADGSGVLMDGGAAGDAPYDAAEASDDATLAADTGLLDGNPSDVDGLDAATPRTLVVPPAWGWRWDGMGGAHELALGDYDGDGATDRAIVHRDSGQWWISASSGADLGIWGWNWTGMAGVHELALGDYDGDGRTDRAIVRRDTGDWWITASSGVDLGIWAWNWTGMAGVHELALGDYDGDGRTDRAIVRRDTGNWWIMSSSGEDLGIWAWNWTGMAGVHELALGDYDGDGKTDRAIVRRDTGDWWIMSSSGEDLGIWAWNWAGMGSVHELALGDYDGDGRTDRAIVRRATGQWWVIPSGGGVPPSFGQRLPHLSSDSTLAVGDYDGDGFADMAFVNRGSGRWFIRPSSNPCPDLRNTLESTPGTPWRVGGGAGYPDMIDPASACTTVVSTREQLVSALAVARPGTAVYIDDSATIDITGVSVVVPDFVTVASGRGRGGSSGALLHSTTPNPAGMLALGEGTRVTGLRIVGHNETQVTECAEGWTSHCDYSRGIRTGVGSEVDNNELRGHVLAAVAVGMPGAHVHHNSITNNQREHLGYGVHVEDIVGATAAIDWNFFDYNRHSVAGSGHRGQRYWVRWNYVAGNGNGHAFDMHHAPLEGAEGTVAATHLEVYGNVVMLADYSVFRVRGRPTEGAWAYGNCIGRARRRPNAPLHQQDAIAQVGTLGNFWIDTDPAGNLIPNRYGQTAASCGPL